MSVLVNLVVDPMSEWFTLTNKDKYAGEVYVELTFWSNVGHGRNGLETILIPFIRNLRQRRNPLESQRYQTRTMVDLDHLSQQTAVLR